MSCPSCDIKKLAEWMDIIQTRVDAINKRTKVHTIDIRELRKQMKGGKDEDEN